MNNQQLIKGFVFGIPISLALFGCGLWLGMSGKYIFYAAALYSSLAIGDWIVRTRNQKRTKNEGNS